MLKVILFIFLIFLDVPPINLLVILKVFTDPSILIHVFISHVGNQEALRAGMDKFSKSRLELDAFKYLSLMSVNLHYLAICPTAQMVIF